MYFVQSLSHIVQVLDPDGNGSLNFVQFSEGVKRIVELQGSWFFHYFYLCSIEIEWSSRKCTGMLQDQFKIWTDLIWTDPRLLAVRRPHYAAMCLWWRGRYVGVSMLASGVNCYVTVLWQLNWMLTCSTGTLCGTQATGCVPTMCDVCGF